MQKTCSGTPTMLSEISMKKFESHIESMKEILEALALETTSLLKVSKSQMQIFLFSFEP